jgi:hypothetical protein
MAPAGWQRVEPHGLGRAILAVTVIFSVSSTICGLPSQQCPTCNQKRERRAASLTFDQVINMVHNSVIVYGTFTGIGTKDADMPSMATYNEGLKALFLWETLYLSGLVFINCSICLTLLRIAVIRWHQITLYALIGVNSVSTVFVTLYLLVQCRPIAAAWNEAEGTCVSPSVTVVITVVVWGLNFVTNLLNSLLPFRMLRHVQMSGRNKRAVVGVLFLDILASVATVARLPFGTANLTKTDLLGKLVGLVYLPLNHDRDTPLSLAAFSKRVGARAHKARSIDADQRAPNL